MPRVSLTNINKAFGETHALNGASLQAELGEVHAIVGENGSGKSTLAKVMSGVVLPDQGTVEVLGGHPKCPADAIALGIATIYQEIMLAEDLSIFENMFAGTDGLWRKSFSDNEKRRQTKELLERLTRTTIDPDARVATLPLSIKQWIVIGRALLAKPKLLIFDESSAALDLDATNRLHDEMRRLRDAGSCVMLVTHRIAELVRIADSATVLRDGETVGHLKKADITEDNLLSLMSASIDVADVGERSKRVVAMAHKPLLMAENVRVTQTAQSFDFRVDTGEIVGLAGLDGAGQTEFVRMLAGIEPLAQGEVHITDSATQSHAIDSLKDAEAAGITYVSGDRKKEGIFPNLSILENFGMALFARHSNRAGIIEQSTLDGAFSGEVERLGIKFGSGSDKITTLSGGNQQKVLIARAFALNPRLIVLNDPARGVDIGTKQELYRHLRAFASNGGAVVYLSSEIEEFFHFADRADVFVSNALFASFRGSDISEAKILPAMFGREEAIEFDAHAGEVA